MKILIKQKPTSHKNPLWPLSPISSFQLYNLFDTNVKSSLPLPPFGTHQTVVLCNNFLVIQIIKSSNF